LRTGIEEQDRTIPLQV